MKATILIEKNHETASARAADIIAAALAAKPELTVTFAAGDTPLACYRLLIARQRAGELELRNAHYIGLDEWIGLGPDDAGSCIEVMNRSYYGPAGIPRSRIDCFDGRRVDADAEAGRMCGVLAQTGGLDLAVLGVGVNGHIGFNEPDTATQGDFSLVPLSETTQTVGRKYFGGGATPTRGATITLDALKKAKTILVIATGEKKQKAAADVLDEVGALPVGAFLDHPGAVYIFDESAAPQGGPAR